MAGQQRPRVSIIVCTRNRADRLRTAVDYLLAHRSQHAWEAIIVDNDSSDETSQFIRALTRTDQRFRAASCLEVGLGASRRHGILESQGEILTFTDDDCYVAEDFVDCVVEVFKEHPVLEVVGGRILLHDRGDAPVTIDERTKPHAYQPYRVVEAGAFHGANLSFRREALLRAGGFDPQLGAGTPFPCEDIDAVAAVVWSGGHAVYDPRPTVSHHHGRKHADIAAIASRYDVGRGAYWFKYIMRRETRWAYAKAWFGALQSYREPHHIRRMYREILGAWRYACARKAWTILLLTAPVSLLFLLYIAAKVGVVRLHRLSSKAARRSSAVGPVM